MCTSGSDRGAAKEAPTWSRQQQPSATGRARILKLDSEEVYLLITPTRRRPSQNLAIPLKGIIGSQLPVVAASASGLGSRP